MSQVAGILYAVTGLLIPVKPVMMDIKTIAEHAILIAVAPEQDIPVVTATYVLNLKFVMTGIPMSVVVAIRPVLESEADQLVEMV